MLWSSLLEIYSTRIECFLAERLLVWRETRDLRPSPSTSYTPDSATALIIIPIPTTITITITITTWLGGNIRSDNSEPEKQYLSALSCY
jgi:hypothetical protein